MNRSARLPPHPPYGSGKPGNGALNSPTSTAPSQADRGLKELPVGRTPLSALLPRTPNGSSKFNRAAGKKLLAAGHKGGRIMTLWLINIGEGRPIRVRGFVEINPNSKNSRDDGPAGHAPQRLFESGSIMLASGEKFGNHPQRPKPTQPNVCAGFFWQMAVHPILGGGVLATSPPMRRSD